MLNAYCQQESADKQWENKRVVVVVYEVEILRIIVEIDNTVLNNCVTSRYEY